MAKPKEKEDKIDIDPFIKAIVGKEGFDGNIGFGTYIPERELISSGSIALDLKLGGGLPRDRVIEYYGKPASGKTSMALVAMANYASKFGYDRTLFIVDVERSITEKFVRGFGLDPNKILVVQPRTAEAALDVLATLVKSGRCGFGMLDSVDAMESDKETQRSLTEQGMMELPKLMSRLMRKLCKDTIDHDCGVIFINQVRSSPALYAPETTSGGNAIPYYAHQRIRWKAKPSDKLKGALKMEPTIMKNKLHALIKAESEFNMIPGKGVELVGDYFSAAKDIGVFVISGPMTKIMDGNKEIEKLKGEDEVKQWIFDNTELTRNLIKNKWDEIRGSLEVQSTDEDEHSLQVESE